MQYKKEIVIKAKAKKFEAASQLPNCAEGETEELANGVQVCHMCEPGFENADEACTALPDPKNCAEVEFSNPKRMCIACKEGYELSEDPEDEDCYPVPSFCKDTTHANGECQACNPGSVLEEGECIPRAVPEGCIDITWGDSEVEDECTECEDG